MDGSRPRGDRSRSDSHSRSRARSGTNRDAQSGTGLHSRRDIGLETAESTYALTAGLGLERLVPAAVARRAIDVAVETDRAVYARGDPVEITVTFRNRLPLPVDVPTPRQRPWGWCIDGELEATDERRYVRDRPSSISFRGGERKRATVTWNGRLERTDEQHESVVPKPGEYEIEAFVATHADRYRPSDSTVIELE
ncbi:hypothetical protein [Halopiger xanaduensis]|uniref:DUF7974 domain-containing protein n=1 Tax=Halopiger xanaduensis (strain DSM 18323 / JCM 14033 / SH-6) TaxID=797210 RepID=F8D2Y0_HALXS|nr:hypothetical protein [Halopiger xanaduensis]AEH36124.1 hypothetical protein Halxa_1492 [Halopiger xanaduensis SH-6]